MIRVLMPAFYLCGGVGVAAVQDDPRILLREALDSLSKFHTGSFRATMAVHGLNEGAFPENPLDDPVEGGFDRKKELAILRSGPVEVIRSGKQIVERLSRGWRLRTGASSGGDEEIVAERLSECRLPHEEAGGWMSETEALRMEGGKENVGERSCAVFQASLTREAARRSLTRHTGVLREKPEAAVVRAAGTVRFFVDPDGVLIRWEIAVDGTLRVRIPGVRDQEFDLKVTRATEVSKLEETVVEIPPAALEILGSGAKEDDKNR